MRYSNKRNQTRRTRLRIRIWLIGATATAGLLLSGIVFVLKNWPGNSVAGLDPMVITTVEPFSDTLPLVRGLSSQLLFRVNIRTKGTNYKLDATGIRFRFSYRTPSNGAPLQNFRAWYGGSKKEYLPTKHVGSDLRPLEQDSYILNIHQPLSEGENYFYVSCDVLVDESPRPQSVHLKFESVRIGTLTYESELIVPEIRKRIQQNIPYYSTGNSDISSLASWNASRDGSGRRPADFNNPFATYHIQAGHIMTNTLHGCLPDIIIEKNGVLRSVTGLKTASLNLRPGGTWIQEAPFAPGDILGVLVMENGSNYLHRNKGGIPGKNKKLATRSTVTLSDYSEETFKEDVAWGNLVVAADSTADVNFENGIRYVKGDLEVRKTGNTGWMYTNSNTSIRIGGNLVLSGGRIALATGGHPVAVKLNGSLVCKSGTLSDQLPHARSKGCGYVTLLTGNAVRLYPGVLAFICDKSSMITGERILDWEQPAGAAAVPGFRILDGCTVKIHGQSAGPVNENSEWLIQEGGTLDLGTAILTGSGTFRMASGSSLITGTASGIYSEKDSGCIRTHKRIFHSEGNYTFNGNARMLYTGVFETWPEPNQVRNFIVDATFHNSILKLEFPVKVSGNFMLQSGSLNKNEFSFDYKPVTASVAVP